MGPYDVFLEVLEVVLDFLEVVLEVLEVALEVLEVFFGRFLGRFLGHVWEVSWGHFEWFLERLGADF